MDHDGPMTGGASIEAGDRTARAADSRATWSVFGGIVLTLLTLTLVRRAGLGGAANVAVGGAIGIGSVLAARWVGLSWDELGLARRHLGRGLAYGGAVLGAVAVVMAIGAAIPATRSLLDDDRAKVSAAAMWLEVLVSTPIGTVVLEELTFRSSLLGLAARETTTWRAVGISSVLFGLWHISPTLSTASGNSATSDLAANPWGLAVTVVLMVVAMTAAGYVFCWLRLRSRSVVAPMMAHLATNSVTFFAAWMVHRYLA